MALIKGKQIATGADGIDTANLVDDAVTNAKIGPSAVDSTEIAAGAIDTAHIGNNQVTAAKVGSDVVVTAGTNAFTADQDMGNNKLTGLATPTLDDDAATKAYVDAAAQGLDIKESVRVRANGNINLAAPGATVDSVAMVLDQRFLADEQSTGTQDGIYLWKGAAVPAVRTDDAQVGDTFAGAFLFVEEGTDADTGWVCTNDQGSDVIGTDALTFTQFSGAGAIIAGTGMTKSGNTLNVIGGTGITANADDIEVDYEATPGNLGVVDAGSTAAVGSLNTAARGDHEHAVSTGAPTANAQVADTNAEGSSANLARADHTHGIPVGSPSSVGTSNANGSSGNFNHSDHVHAAPHQTTSNKDMAASLTASDNDPATATAIASTPALDGMVSVHVNGVQYKVGDGVKTGCACYFSGDAGATARAIAAIVATDTLHWNGSIVGFELATTDRIDLDYLAF